MDGFPRACGSYCSECSDPTIPAATAAACEAGKTTVPSVIGGSRDASRRARAILSGVDFRTVAALCERRTKREYCFNRVARRMFSKTGEGVGTGLYADRTPNTIPVAAALAVDAMPFSLWLLQLLGLQR